MEEKRTFNQAFDVALRKYRDAIDRYKECRKIVLEHISNELLFVIIGCYNGEEDEPLYSVEYIDYPMRGDIIVVDDYDFDDDLRFPFNSSIKVATGNITESGHVECYVELPKDQIRGFNCADELTSRSNWKYWKKTGKNIKELFALTLSKDE